jgi:Domain of unknown function (DUF5060)
MTTKIAAQWHEIDIAFAGPDVGNPYTDVDASVIFTHASGEQLRRPVFWDGGTTYRTVSPQPSQLVNGSGVFTPRVLSMISNQIRAR